MKKLRPRELNDLFNCSAGCGKDKANIQKPLGLPCAKTFLSSARHCLKALGEALKSIS